MIKITTLHVVTLFLYISLQSRNNYDVKWRNFRVFWGRKRQGDKFYHLCLNSGAAPLFSSTINPPLLSNWATWDNHEMVWKDAESIFQGRFHGRRRCRIVRSLKQQRRRRLQKRHLKGEFALLQTLSRLFHLVYFVKCRRIFLKFNSKGLYQSSG